MGLTFQWIFIFRYSFTASKASMIIEFVMSFKTTKNISSSTIAMVTERDSNCKRSDKSQVQWGGTILFVQSLERNLDDIGVGRYRRDTRVGHVSEPFNRLTSATRRIHSAGIPRKAQIPSRASTCPIASFLESWPGQARGHARIFEAGGRFLLNCCSIRRRKRSFFFLVFYSVKMGIKIQQSAQQIPLKSIAAASSADCRIFPQQVALSHLSYNYKHIVFNVWYFWHYVTSQLKLISSDFPLN